MCMNASAERGAPLAQDHASRSKISSPSFEQLHHDDMTVDVLDSPSADGGRATSPHSASNGDGILSKDLGIVICMVPGCGCNLTDSPYYLKRHRVCQNHMKAKTVLLEDGVHRFCQQCGRLQPLSDFKGERKSCDAALQAHNARRRQMNATLDAAALVTEKRARNVRRSYQAEDSDEAPVAADPPCSSRVNRRRVPVRSTSSCRMPSEDPKKQKRVMAAAGRETHSGGDPPSSSRGSKSPTASMQTSEEPDSQRQVQQRGKRSRTPTPSRSSSPAAAPGAAPVSACGTSAQRTLSGSTSVSPLQHALSGTNIASQSDLAALQPSQPLPQQQQQQPAVFQINGISVPAAALGRVGRSRLGLLTASSPSAAQAPGPSMQLSSSPSTAAGLQPHLMPSRHQSISSVAQQQQPCSPAAALDALLPPTSQGAGMQCAAGQDLGPALGVHSSSAPCSSLLSSWVEPEYAQHSLQLQGMWPAAAPSTACMPIAAGEPASGRSAAAAVSGSPDCQDMFMSQHVLQQQQQGLLPQQQQQQQCMPGAWPIPAQQQLWQQQQQCAWASASAPVPAQAALQHQSPAGQLLNEFLLQEHQQQQGLQQQQQVQDQSWIDGLLNTNMDTDAAEGSEAGAAAAPASSNTRSSTPEQPCDSAAAAAAAAANAAVGVWRCAAGCDAAASPVSAAGPAPAAVSLSGNQPGVLGAQQEASTSTGANTHHAAAAAGGDSGGAASAATAHAHHDAGCDTLDEALDMIDVMLQSDPNWLVAQTSLAATASVVTLGSGSGIGNLSSSTPGSSIGAAADVSGKLSDFGVPSTGLPADAAFAAASAAALASRQGSGVYSSMLAAQPSLLPHAGAGAACMHTPADLVPADVPASMMLQRPLSPLTAASLGYVGAGLTDPALEGLQAHLHPAAVVMRSIPGDDMNWDSAWQPMQADPVGLQPSSTLQASMHLHPPQGPVLPADGPPAAVQHSTAAQVQQQQALLLQQRLQQEQQQMQHYIVRLSVKLHGVTPEQLPSRTVQALEELVIRYAGQLDAVMVNPAFRRGCVQMEFDLLVKPQGWTAGPAAAATAAAGDAKPGQQTAWLQASGDLLEHAAAAAGSKAWASGRAAGSWGHVLEALSSCPGTAAAEEQLRAALPFAELLEVLLQLPVSNSAETAESDAASAAADAVAAASSTVGGHARAIYAQIGDCLGIWTADKGFVQDWAPAVFGMAQVQHDAPGSSTSSSIDSSSSTSSSIDSSSSTSIDSSAASVSVDGRPCFTNISTLCTSAAAAASLAAAAGDQDSTATSRQQPHMQPVLLEVAVQPGGTAAQTGCHSDRDRSSSSSWGSVADESSNSDLNLWCTSKGAFVPLASRPAAGDAGLVAGDATMTHQLQVLLGLPGPSPGLLLLQAEQLTRAVGSSSSAASSRHSSQGYSQQLQQQLEEGPRNYPLPLMSRAVPIVVCPSTAMAAEVSVLLPDSSSSSQAALLLQQLGLLLDFWSMWQQQQQLGCEGQELSQRQQWQRSLLGKQQYLDVMRSACCMWLRVAAQHSMPAAQHTLLDIWSALSSSPPSADQSQPPAVDAAAPVDSPQPAAAGAASASVASAGAAAGTESLADRPALPLSPVKHRALQEGSSSGGGNSSSSSSSQPAEPPTAETPAAVAAGRRRVLPPELVPAVAVLAVLLVLLAVKLWWSVQRGELHLHRLYAMLQQAWQFSQALALPSAVMAAGGVLMVLVVWQQEQERLAAGAAAASSSKKCVDEEGGGLGADAPVDE